MSGIEVVGIVLGALPLAISLFRWYEDLAAANNRLRDFEKLYRNVLRDLEHEELLFRLIIETLVRPLVNDEMIHKDDLDRIVNNTDDSSWADQDISEALHQRLGDAHMPFIQVLEDTEKQCMQLLKSIGFDKPSIQNRIFTAKTAGGTSSKHADDTLMSKTRQAYVKFDFQMERIKFATNKTKQETFISNIQKNNEKLERFLKFGGKVAALREDSTPSSRHSSLAKHVLQYWKHAQRLHDLLGRAWGCQCRDHHHARLYLQHRTSPAFEFCLLVLFSSSPLAAHPWREQDLKIEHVKTSDLVNAITIPLPTTPVAATAGSTVSGTGLPTTSKPSFSSRFKKRFDDRKKKVSIQGPSVPPSPATRPAVSPSPSTTSNLGIDIEHMCNIMSTRCKKAECIGALRDEISDQTYSVSLQPLTQTSSDSMSLKELLLDTAGRELYRNQTYAIALAMCSSHLQLQSTAWATEVWTASDINFPLDNGVPVLNKPYINAGFQHSQATSSSPPAATADRLFVCLGIVLLELCCHMPIESCEWWQKLGFSDAQKSEPLYRLIVAGKWLDKVESNEGPAMASAIRWCLNESPRVFLNEQWRRDLAVRVVSPVQNCCRYLSGTV